VGIYAMKPAFRATLKPIERALLRARVTPDMVTLAGLAFAAGGGAGFVLGRDGSAWLVLVPVAAFLRTAANALDGMIAADTGTARPAGEVLNETVDRLADIAVFLPLLAVPRVPDELVAGAVAAMLVTSFVAVAVKAAGGPRLSAGVMGKPDRMAVAGVAAVLALWVDPPQVFTVMLWVVLAGCAVTIVQRAIAARRALGSSA
jgi:CDP-diacylglycerol---glycerol-3-phosphate 3-phosphatidyltransferase